MKTTAKKKPEPKKTDQETDVTADKEVKDFFAIWKAKKQEELEDKKMKVVRRDSRLSWTGRKQ
jgi:hypothetical protein